MATAVQRIRVRKIGADLSRGEGLEAKRVISKQNCLAVPHIGEALDRMGGRAFFGHWAGDEARELHYGHPVGIGMRSGGTPECGERCVVVDAVSADLAIGADEIEVK